MSAGVITREIAEAGVGTVRLIRYDPRWPDGFTPTAGGFVRSFLGPLLALPFYLVSAGLFPDEQAAPVAQVLWAAGISHVLNAIAFPALVAAAARPLGIGEGYAGFIIVVNWASLFLNVCLAAASLLQLGGETGRNIFMLISLALFAISIFVTWRAAREILSPEIPIALLIVVLSVAIGALVAQVVSFAFGVPAVG